MDDKRIKQIVDEITAKANAEAQTIEFGWLSLKRQWIPPTAGMDQINDMRMAFFAGAQHLWACVNSLMTEDREPTEADMLRLSRINLELSNFYTELKRCANAGSQADNLKG